MAFEIARNGRVVVVAFSSPSVEDHAPLLAELRKAREGSHRGVLYIGRMRQDSQSPSSEYRATLKTHMRHLLMQCSEFHCAVEGSTIAMAVQRTLLGASLVFAGMRRPYRIYSSISELLGALSPTILDEATPALCDAALKGMLTTEAASLLEEPRSRSDRPGAERLSATMAAALRSSAVVPSVAATDAPPTPARIDVVAIGSSTGGPDALHVVLGGLRAGFPVPIVVTQHMPAKFTALLANRLAITSGLQVAEARGGETPEPGHVYVAPGGYHLGLRGEGPGRRLHLHLGPPENSCRPAADVMFREVARSFGRHALAVVLTGMGQDGLRGCEQIRQAGGQVIVQDEESSVVWGMPGAVAKAGLAQAVTPLDAVAAEIAARVLGRHGARAHASSRALPIAKSSSPSEPIRWRSSHPLRKA